MSVTVRRANRDDADRIADFAMKLVEQHVRYDEQRFARISTLEGMRWFYGGQTEVEHAAVFVAEIENKVVGFAYVTYDEKSYVDLATSLASLHDIYVEESARGTGAAQLLIDASVAFAKSEGATKLMLHVAVKNVGGNAFFEKYGFRPTMTEMMLGLTGEREP
jgi:ribosomal protein S18 acetylase RimI-like enzyme